VTVFLADTDQKLIQASGFKASAVLVFDRKPQRFPLEFTDGSKLVGTAPMPNFGRCQRRRSGDRTGRHDRSRQVRRTNERLSMARHMQQKTLVRILLIIHQISDYAHYRLYGVRCRCLSASLSERGWLNLGCRCQFSGPG
jgi:hypothetical protein